MKSKTLNSKNWIQRIIADKVVPEIWEFVDDILSVISLCYYWVVEEREEGQLFQAGDGLQVGQLLQGVVGEDQGVQVGKTKLQPFSKPNNSVVVEQTQLIQFLLF